MTERQIISVLSYVVEQKWKLLIGSNSDLIILIGTVTIKDSKCLKTK